MTQGPAKIRNVRLSRNVAAGRCAPRHPGCRELDAGALRRGTPRVHLRRDPVARRPSEGGALAARSIPATVTHDEEEEAERPTDRPYPFGFLIDLGSRDFANGFERTLSLAWFDDLEVRVETPGCDALEAVCTAAACRLR